MVIFTVKNLTKKFDKSILFENISFGVNLYERIGIIGRNGIGKTTLLRIIAGMDFPDTGEVIFNNNTTFGYLEQNPLFNSELPVLDEVLAGRKRDFELLDKYNTLCHKNLSSHSDEFNELQDLAQKIDERQLWNLENEAKSIISALGINEFYKPCSQLSGGQRKRVALAKLLFYNPDLLIMDGPTNHLDTESIQWLQDFILKKSKSLLFITHDRYFLDAVSTKILEIDERKIFWYDGDYEDYIEKKTAYIEAINSTAEHTRSKLLKELEWLKKSAPARRKKQKSRIDWISEISAEIKKIEEKKIKIELGKTFLGNRIIEAHYISKSVNGKLLFSDFSYIAKPGDRIGLIGPNGCGKSTLLNILAGIAKPDSGTIRIGDTVKIGYYKQELNELDENKTVLATLREIAEYIDCGVGRDRYLSARDLLNRFLFPPEQHNALVSTLSGGEKRRLSLLKVLMQNPNVLLLDEPTNDLDIQTLNSLEDYLEDFYGVLIIVSHDRAFLDKTTHFTYAFENGKIKEYPGNYTFYLQNRILNEPDKLPKIEKKQPKPVQEKQSKKLSYNEQREYNALLVEIDELEKRKADLENSISNLNPEDFQKANEIYTELNQLIYEINEKIERWLELESRINS